MAQGIERFSAPPPGDDFDPTGEAQFRRLIEQFMENADYRVRDVGNDVESIDTRVGDLETSETDHESRISTLEALGLRVIDSGAATVVGTATTVVTSDPAIGSGSIGICIVSKDADGPLGDFDEAGSLFQLHNADESTTLNMQIVIDSSPVGVGVVLHGQHPGTPDHYDLQIKENSGSNVDIHYVIAELFA